MFWVLFASSDESACVVLKTLIKQAEGTQSVKVSSTAASGDQRKPLLHQTLLLLPLQAFLPCSFPLCDSANV